MGEVAGEVGSVEGVRFVYTGVPCRAGWRDIETRGKWNAGNHSRRAGSTERSWVWGKEGSSSSTAVRRELSVGLQRTWKGADEILRTSFGSYDFLCFGSY